MQGQIPLKTPPIVDEIPDVVADFVENEHNR